MRLGVITTSLLDHDMHEGLDRIAELGIDVVELACGGYERDLRYGHPARLLKHPDELNRWMEEYERRGVTIGALAMHGRPLSPDPIVASEYDEQLKCAFQLAEKIGVHRVTLLAGLPEGATGDRTPTWIACPGDYEPSLTDALQWQWEKRVIPYWREHAGIAVAHGCQLCFEMQPGDVLHHPEALLRLRAEIGSVIGCNFDPSHLVWQGIDVPASIRMLGDAIGHAHAKGVAFNPECQATTGVLSTAPMADSCRPWRFTVAGRGQTEQFWGEFFRALDEAGFDGIVSIEHEDEEVPRSEGVAEAFRFLAPLMEARTEHSSR